MRYAVIGAAGQVGQEFTKCLPPDRLVRLSRNQIDVSDPASVNECLGRLDCDVVINLAAFHDVNGSEDDPARAFRVNALGALFVARAGRQTGRKIVFFSSDYVFGQEAGRPSPYLEQDPVGPLNVYGVSKDAGEQLIRATTDQHLIVRTSSLFGVVTSKKGWTFPEMIINRARNGQPLKVVNDQYMSPTYTLDLVRTVIALLEVGATGTVHITNAGGCTWFEFASSTLEMAGLDYDVKPVGSDAFPSKAVRPTYSRLDSARFESLGIGPMRHWREALQAYLEEKGLIAG